MWKDDIKNIINNHIEDSELAVKIFEEIDDYEYTTDNDGVNEYEEKYNELLEKYRARFLNGEPVEDKKEASEDETVIDITEI